MQAHALTPHLEDMLAAAFESERAGGPVGQEPILTLLVSGKHVRHLLEIIKRSPWHAQKGIGSHFLFHGSSFLSLVFMAQRADSCYERPC